MFIECGVIIIVQLHHIALVPLCLYNLYTAWYFLHLSHFYCRYTSSPTALDLKELLTEILSALEITPGFFAAATTTEFRVSDDVFPQLAKFLLLAQYVDLRPFGERWVKDIHMYKSPGEFCQAEADYTAKSIYLLGLCGSKAFQFGNDIAAQKKLSRLLSSLEMILTSEKNRDCLLIQYCVAHCILRLAAIAPTFTSSVLTYWLSEKRGQIPKTLQDRFNRFHQIFNSKKKL